ncbi:DNA polymerase III subunit delta [Rhodanobacter panaciterrae]|uniref:DNA polymerase III subunit delta n=1 Tax=Rhodanobacter panaciterrae TaxID=490572 RepID=A0ABQ2ZVY8_9GAMM|nr:DNA polymerase III subunit delta [Rhodanobacter panaciterrae]GGY24039.1 DNA polymerase III subunit delta [Rhodanobacter panaciterrae]
MPLSFGQWQKALTADRLAPVYLLAGEELLVLEAADALRAQAKKLGYSEREVIDVTQHFDWDDLARSAAGMSLFATRRLIDLRLPTGRPGTEGAKAINAFCADPPPDVTLLITAMEWSNKHDGAWSKKLDASGTMVVFNAPRPNEWGAWIGARLASRGLSATPDAIGLLAERVEGNLLAAAQEIDKLAILRGSAPDGDAQPNARRIDAAEMENLVADSARYDVFKLTDAAFIGDGARALRILAGLRSEGDELLALMGWLVNQLQLALRLANAHDLAAQIRTEHLWQAREQLFRQALRRAPREHWLQCLARASRIDRMVKGRESGNPWQEAERLIAAIAEPRAAKALA